MPEEKRFFVEISSVYFLLAEESYEKGNVEKAADYTVKGLEINYDLKLNEKFKDILIQAGKMNIDKNPQKAILYFDFALRLVNNDDYIQYEKEKNEINKLRKKAINNLPLKERIVKIISDIYS